MFLLATYSLFLFFSILIYISHKKCQVNKYFKLIPGPPPVFLLGNLNYLFGIRKHERLGKLIDLVNIHGPIMKLQVGPFYTIIVITEAKFLEYILSSSKYIDKSVMYSFLHSWIGTGLLTSTGEKWKKRRRMITPAFHFSILESFVEVFESVSDIFIEKLSKEVDKDSVNIAPLVTLCTLDIICEAAMGSKLNTQNEKSSEYVKCVKFMCNNFEFRVTKPMPLYIYRLTFQYRKEKQALKILHGYTDSIIDKRMTEKINDSTETKHAKKKRPAFLDLLLESTIDGKPLSRSDIREEVDTFMFEGHDTTSSAISFTLYCLATNPEVQERVIEEQKTIFEDFKNAKPTITELNEMKYLELVIKESLRLYPPIPILGRTFSEDVQWAGTVYPKDTNLILPIYAIHRNPDYFKDPEKFIPERFIDSTLTNPYVYSPFSAGPRNCIGQKFAMLELKSVLSKTLRNFELFPPKPIQELQVVAEVVLLSYNGVCLSFKKRN